MQLFDSLSMYLMHFFNLKISYKESRGSCISYINHLNISILFYVGTRIEIDREKSQSSHECLSFADHS